MRASTLLDTITPHVSSSVFRRSFALFLLAATLPALAAALLLVRQSSRQLLARARQTVEVLLEEERRILERRTDELDAMVSQFIADPGVRRYLTDQFRSASRVETMLGIFSFVRNLRQARDVVVDSIYLFDAAHDTVLGDTLYRLSDFPDRTVLDGLDPRNVYATAPSAGEGAGLVSYVHRFAVYDGVPGVTVALTLRVEGFLGDLAFARSPHPVAFAVYTESGGEVYASDPSVAGLDGGEVARILASPGEVLRISRGRFHVRSASIDRLGWRLVCLQPLESLLDASRLAASVALPIAAAVVLLSLAAAYVLTVLITRPLARLAASLGPGGDGTRATDEYRRIRELFARLETENTRLDEKVRVARPYLRDHSVSDLLAGRPAGSLADVLALLGVDCPHPRFLLALVDFAPRPFTEELRAEIVSLLDRHGDRLAHVVSRDGTSAALVTVNTSAEAAEDGALFRELHEGLAARGIASTISVGRPCRSLEELPAEYGPVRRKLGDTFFTGRNRVAFADEEPRSGAPAVRDRRIEEELVRHLQLGDGPRTLGAFDRLRRDLVDKGTTMELFRYAFFQLLSDAVASLREMGVDATGCGLDLEPCYASIRAAGSLEELDLYARRSLESLLALRDRFRAKGRELVVGGAIRFLEQSYHREISLEDVGEAVCLNPRYLARLFKAETGRTVFEYLTELRMGVAATQLEDTLRVKDVARSVGYGSVQSFLRHFKKRFGMTPLEYRRSRMAWRVGQEGPRE